MPAKTGRPPGRPKATEERLSTQLLLTQTEIDLLQRASEIVNQPRAVFIRTAALARARAVVEGEK